MSAVDIAVQIKEVDEGFSETPYYDTKKIPTYGHGFVCIVNGKQCKPYDPLPKMYISEQESLKRLRGMADVNEKSFINNPDLFRAYKNCNDVQKAVLLSMAHQLGIYGVLLFKGLLNALAKKDFELAAKECLDSKAARTDAPKRFRRNAEMLKTGKLHDYYLE